MSIFIGFLIWITAFLLPMFVVSSNRKVTKKWRSYYAQSIRNVQ